MADLPPKRRRGRPTLGVTDHRHRLLAAARDSFAANGYAATTLRQVALRSGVTPALAHYYFADKSGLLKAVHQQHVAPLIAGIHSVLVEYETDPASALAKFIQQFMFVATRHPWLPGLIVRDPQIMSTLAEKLQALVAAGQAAQAIRDDLRAEWIVQSVLSLCLYPFLSGTVSATTAPAMTLHHLAVLQDGLRKPSYNPRQDPGSYPKTSKSRA